MRPLLAALAAAVTTVLVLQVSRAHALESFTLDEKDKVIAESLGCHAECRVQATGQRLCTLRDFDCKAICMTIPECTPIATGRPIKVCAVVKGRP